ncbi:MAG: DUF1905 domain-containing protein [Nitrospinae bacterium]|nr:DUF1905 domain-containing protein [Nitrospinota bacterium]
MKKKNVFKTRGKVWLYDGGENRGCWHFVSMPKDLSAELKARFATERRGFGSLKVSATVGKTSWRTSIFPENKEGAFILPLKADVRAKEKISAGDSISFSVEIGGA